MCVRRRDEQSRRSECPCDCSQCAPREWNSNRLCGRVTVWGRNHVGRERARRVCAVIHGSFVVWAVNMCELTVRFINIRRESESQGEFYAASRTASHDSRTKPNTQNAGVEMPAARRRNSRPGHTHVQLTRIEDACSSADKQRRLARLPCQGDFAFDGLVGLNSERAPRRARNEPRLHRGLSTRSGVAEEAPKHATPSSTTAA